MKSEFGSIKYEVKRGEGKWVIRGARPTMMIKRVITSAYSPEPNVVNVGDNTVNVEHLEWIMMRYPLEIKSPNEWNDRLEKLRDYEKITSKVKKLKRISPPATFKGTLFNYQKEALDFLNKTQGHALIADEMGLGKTIMSLAYIAQEQKNMPVLIIAPLVTLRNWEREIHKFLGDHLKVYLIRSGKPDPLPEADFYIINYDMIWRRIDDIIKLPIRTLIMDEVQSLRAQGTNKYKAVIQVSGLQSLRNKIGLSGTPIYNRGSEIWGICDIIRPGMLGTYWEFVKAFCGIDHRGRHFVNESARDTLREELRDKIMLRRKKSDVLKELKEKVRYKEIIEYDTEYYENQLDDIKKKLELDQINAKTSFEWTAAIQRASESERQAAGVAKVPHVVKFVENVLENDETVVVFCHHVAVHELLYQRLMKYNPSKIIGGQSDSVRQNEIDRFQFTGKYEKFPYGRTNLMIAGLRAGNVGINLTRAKYVIFAELDWSPAIHRQAEDRLHRIGQKEVVFAYYLVANGTLDENVARVLVDKALEIDKVIDDKVETFENESYAKEVLEKFGMTEKPIQVSE